jgi:hypothetical protein
LGQREQRVTVCWVRLNKRHQSPIEFL